VESEKKAAADAAPLPRISKNLNAYLKSADLGKIELLRPTFHSSLFTRHF
jgi:hypothetical protein